MYRGLSRGKPALSRSKQFDGHLSRAEANSLMDTFQVVVTTFAVTVTVATAMQCTLLIDLPHVPADPK
jgi:hypothetical protein